jgi:transposase
LSPLPLTGLQSWFWPLRKGERVAVHLPGGGRGRHTTIPEHMPSAHRRYAEWTIERIRAEAAAIGPSTAKLSCAFPRLL